MVKVVQCALASNREGAFMACVSSCGSPATITRPDFRLDPDKCLISFYEYHELNRVLVENRLPGATREAYVDTAAVFAIERAS